ncbi:CopD family protein [Brevundimonas sp. R86498]|uniref:CopD family protein n=1 Tax=Brevundimonas sp. R86498 TaxID=3093845 RepID=UPI0037CC515A
MIDWLVPAVPLFKAAHIIGLVIWVGGLLVLPLMLTRHSPDISRDDYRTIRTASHITYTLFVTPAAVIAVIAGTWLIFLREVYVPWMFAKLAFVAALVMAHAWIGHVVARVGEEPSEHTPPAAYVPIALVIVPVLMILTLVLAKPVLGWIAFPDWLTEPRSGQFFFDTPRR